MRRYRFIIEDVVLSIMVYVQGLAQKFQQFDCLFSIIGGNIFSVSVFKLN